MWRSTGVRARSLRTTPQSAQPHNSGWRCDRSDKLHLTNKKVGGVGAGVGGGGGGTDADVKVRIGRARAAFQTHILKNIWASPNLAVNIKIMIFNVTVKPVQRSEELNMENHGYDIEEDPDTLTYLTYASWFLVDKSRNNTPPASSILAGPLARPMLFRRPLSRHRCFSMFQLCRELDRFYSDVQDPNLDTCLRGIFRMQWPETIINREHWKRTKQQPPEDEIL